MSRYWPDVSDAGKAESAVHTGAAWCYFVAGITVLIATVSMFTGKPIAGISGWAFVDAAIFGFAGWRISKFSRVWSVIAFFMFVAEKIFMLSNNRFNAGALVLGFIIAVGLLGSIRGTFAHHRLANNSAQSFAATANN